MGRHDALPTTTHPDSEPGTIDISAFESQFEEPSNTGRHSETQGSVSVAELQERIGDEYTAAPESATETVDASASRVDRSREEGARLFETGKDALRAGGKVVAAKAFEGGKILLGGASLGLQEGVTIGKSAVAKGKTAWNNTRSRVHQYRLDRAHGKALAEQSTRDKAAQDEAYASYATNLQAARNNELQGIARDELARLDTVRVGDADAFNAKAAGLDAGQEAVVDAAKRYRVNQAREEALAMNETYDREAAEHEARVEREMRQEQERIERENAEYDDAYDKAEAFLKRYKGKKDIDLATVKQELALAFPAKAEHLREAYDDAFDAFAGKKLKAAARAARIKRGREKITAYRRQKYESARDTVRTSETYQKARSTTRSIGKALGRFAKRTASVARRATAAAGAGLGAARGAWSGSRPTTESESTDNE